MSLLAQNRGVDQVLFLICITYRPHEARTRGRSLLDARNIFTFANRWAFQATLPIWNERVFAGNVFALNVIADERRVDARAYPTWIRSEHLSVRKYGAVVFA